MDNNTDYGLGRIYIPDERDKGFPMSAILTRQKPEIDYKYYWPKGWWGDQGEKPYCCAYAWLHWLHGGSVTQMATPPPVIGPKILYDLCQANDSFPGNQYDGTTVRAGAKVLMDEGFISEYRWTNDVKVMAEAVLTKGPVVVGTDWHRNMFYPDKDGVIRTGGGVIGGHAYLIDGVNMVKKQFRAKNSWGREWAKKGYAYIPFEDMQELLWAQGECCLASEIKKTT